MATFISTIKFTEKGLAAVHDTTKRAAAFKAAVRKMGAKVTDFYWTLGAYDGVLILEAPDDETATAALLQLSSAGNVHSSTVRAFNASEMESVLAKMAAPSGKS